MAQYVRAAKNKILAYSIPQVKVRDATSNDPWGPNSAMLAELGSLSHDPVALQEMLEILLKRLNDLGKNWRHVHKSLIVLEYLCLAGNSRIYNYCVRNRHIIDTLKTFQFADPEGRDHGVNVREKAKSFAQILDDPELFKAEQAKLAKAGGRSRRDDTSHSNNTVNDPRSQQSGSNVDSNYNRPYRQNSSDAGAHFNDDIRKAMPRTVEEEEAQVQMAKAMSQREHERNSPMMFRAPKLSETEAPRNRAYENQHSSDQILATQPRPPSMRQKVDLLNFGLDDEPAPSNNDSFNMGPTNPNQFSQNLQPPARPISNQFNSNPLLFDSAPISMQSSQQTVGSMNNLPSQQEQPKKQMVMQDSSASKFIGNNSNLVDLNLFDNKTSNPFLAQEPPNKTPLKNIPGSSNLSTTPAGYSQTSGLNQFGGSQQLNSNQNLFGSSQNMYQPPSFSSSQAMPPQAASSYQQQRIPQQGFSQQGFPQQGFQQQGLPQQGFPQQGFSQQGLPQQGFPQQGIQQPGFQQQAFQQKAPQNPMNDPFANFRF